MTWRFIDLGEIEPFLGPAIFEAVADAIEKKKSDDTILFWRPKTPAVYIGFHQLAGEDIDIEACKKQGTPIVRRTLGGGTGYCDRNQIIYNIIYDEERRGIPQGPRAAYLHILKGLIAALRILDINCASIDEERYSVHVNGKKISGSGQLSSKGVTDSSGSFLVDFDFPGMSKLLKNPVKNLRPWIREPEEGMTCLRRETKRAISMPEASAALRKGFESVLGKTIEGQLSQYEKDLSENLKDKYLTDEWTYRADKRRSRRGVISPESNSNNNGKP